MLLKTKTQSRFPEINRQDIVHYMADADAANKINRKKFPQESGLPGIWEV